MRSYLVVTFSIGVFPTWLAYAETLSLDQALVQALNSTPATAHIYRNATERDARALELETLPNPELELDAIVADSNGSDGLAAELTIPVKPSYFSDRRALAEAMRRTASLEERTQILAVMHEVTREYISLWMLQKHTEVLRESLEFASRTDVTIQHAARSGELRQSESHLFHAETLKFQVELREREFTMEAQQLTLLQRLGLEAQPIVLAYPRLPLLPTDLEQLKNLVTVSPRQILEARRKESELRLRVTKMDAYFPDFSPRLLYSRGYDDGREEFGIGVRIHIPLWDRNAAENSRARSEKQLVETLIAAYDRLGYDRLLEMRRKKAKATLDNLQQYEDAILPAYKKSFNATRDMFKGGQASVLQLWQVHERLLEVQLKTLEVHREAFEALMELETLLGQPLGGKHL